MRARLDLPASREGDLEGARRLSNDVQTAIPLHLSRTFSSYLEARTRFFDRQVIEVSEMGECQVVILGAGYDDRALRFRRTGVRFIEVDHPNTQHDKLRRLRRLGVAVDTVAFVAVDFSKDDIRGALGKAVAPDLPVLFLCEGLIPYLPRHVVDQLLVAAAVSPASNRRLAAEVPVRPSAPSARLTLRILGMATGMSGERMRTVFASPAEAQRALLGAGWQPTSWQRGRDLAMPSVSGDVVYAVATA